MNNIKKNVLGVVTASLLLPQVAGAMTIGHFDGSRESYGFAGSYISQAEQWLVDQGHTLVSTSTVDGAFLSGVDAFYTGLLSGSVSGSEVSALQNFVDVQGGFLFIQTDWADAPWTGAANTILSNWGIAHGGSYGNDGGHYTVGSSSWVTDPNTVTGFIGSAHSVVTSAPGGFEVLARDSADEIIMGVFDAGGGRSSDVLIATDINFWDDSFGWTDIRNRDLWENIWQSVSAQTDGDGDNEIPAPGSLLLLLSGLLGFTAVRRTKTAG